MVHRQSSHESSPPRSTHPRVVPLELRVRTSGPVESAVRLHVHLADTLAHKGGALPAEPRRSPRPRPQKSRTAAVAKEVATTASAVAAFPHKKAFAGAASRGCASLSAAATAAIAKVHMVHVHRSESSRRSDLKFVRHANEITQAEVLGQAGTAVEVSDKEEKAPSATNASLKLLRHRSRISFLGAMLNDLQRDRDTEQGEAGAPSASDVELAKLLNEVGARADDIMRTLSDWDAEYKGDGMVNKRDFRRTLALMGIHADRHVAE